MLRNFELLCVVFLEKIWPLQWEVAATRGGGVRCSPFPNVLAETLHTQLLSTTAFSPHTHTHCQWATGSGTLPQLQHHAASVPVSRCAALSFAHAPVCTRCCCLPVSEHSACQSRFSSAHLVCSTRCALVVVTTCDSQIFLFAKIIIPDESSSYKHIVKRIPTHQQVAKWRRDVIIKRSPCFARASSTTTTFRIDSRIIARRRRAFRSATASRITIPLGSCS